MTRLRAVQQPLRAVVYVRQSVAREESISLDVQEQACRDYAARSGYEVAAVVADPGVSGLKWDRRPGVQRVMRMVEARDADVVLVWRWSRLSRKRLHQAVALDTIERAGARVESATEPFDTTTAGGEFGRDVMLAAAHFESRQKGEQWRDAHNRRRAAGLPHTTAPRLGYLWDGQAYTPDPDTAPVVRELYRRSADGQGRRDLAAWLASVGVVSPKTGRAWTSGGLGYFLGSGFAAGLLHVHDPDCGCTKLGCTRRIHVPGSHKPIITQRQWRAHLRAVRSRAATAPRLLAPATILSGLVRCGSCGHSMPLRSDRIYGPAYSYNCRNADTCQARTSVTRKRAEEAVMEWLRERQNDLESAVRAAPVESEGSATRKAERARLTRQVTDAQRAIVQLTKDRARGLVPDTAYREALAELEAERDRAAARADDLADPAPPPPSRRMITGLLNEWDTLAVSARRDALAELLHLRIHRQPGRRSSIEIAPPWKPPL